MLRSSRRLRRAIGHAVALAFTINASDCIARAEGRPADALSAFLAPVAGGRFLDQDGREVSAGDLRGSVVAVAFFGTDCSILCVSRLLDLAAVEKALPAAERGRVRILALAADPGPVAPEALRGFGETMRLDPSAVTLAAGRPGGAAALFAAIGWRPDAGGPDKVPPTVFVFDREGGFAMRYAAAPLDKRRLGQDLAALADLDHGVGQGVAEASNLH